MLVRIVKLTFKKENIASFERIFEENQKYISAFEGCRFLELYRDIDHPEVFFTYSHWKNVEALEAYRNSALFKTVWKRTKALFDKKTRGLERP